MKNLKSEVTLQKPERIWLLLWSLCAFGSLSGQESNRFDNESVASPIGEVSLVIGKAYIDSNNDRVLRAEHGDFIREGDTIRTESNGHVHIRFVDDAVLSVRPRSQLEIIAYRFDRANPNNSLVKLNLIEGTARTVSGEAAKTARDQFRLNTPTNSLLNSCYQLLK